MGIKLLFSRAAKAVWRLIPDLKASYRSWLRVQPDVSVVESSRESERPQLAGIRAAMKAAQRAMGDLVSTEDAVVSRVFLGGILH